MGIDLTLAPVPWHESMTPWLLHDRCILDRQGDLLDTIRKIEAQPVPGGVVQWYGDDGIQRRPDDPYGSPLKFARAWQFRNCPTSGLTQRNRAAMAWIGALPTETPVVLWWH